MDELTDKQISWIGYRDTTAQNEVNSFGGDSFAGVQIFYVKKNSLNIDAEKRIISND